MFKQPPNPLPAGLAFPGLTGGGFGGFLRPMTELRKQMEEGISADEILEALSQIVVEKVVENRARMVERQFYGYPPIEQGDTAGFLMALRKIITNQG